VGVSLANARDRASGAACAFWAATFAARYVTTNNVTADQAIITDSVTTGGDTRNVGSLALLPASSEIPMPILSETGLPDPVGVGGGKKSK